jgi:hypothetical protein
MHSHSRVRRPSFAIPVMGERADTSLNLARTLTQNSEQLTELSRSSRHRSRHQFGRRFRFRSRHSKRSRRLDRCSADLAREPCCQSGTATSNPIRPRHSTRFAFAHGSGCRYCPLRQRRPRHLVSRNASHAHHQQHRPCQLAHCADLVSRLTFVLYSSENRSSRQMGRLFAQSRELVFGVKGSPSTAQSSLRGACY